MTGILSEIERSGTGSTGQICTSGREIKIIARSRFCTGRLWVVSLDAALDLRGSASTLDLWGCQRCLPEWGFNVEDFEGIRYIQRSLGYG